MADWIPDPAATGPKDGTKIWLHFPGEAEEVRLGAWVDRELHEYGAVTQKEIGWLMADRAEVRAPEDPADWQPAEPQPPPPAASRHAA